MLIEFRVSNFRSIKDEQVLSLVANKDKTHLESHTIETGIKAVPRLVKSAVIYGPNASGKSNLVRALAFMQAVIRDSTNIGNDTKYLQLQTFRLNTLTRNQPTTFEITFIMKGVRHQYGFSLTQESILDEWLYVYKTAKPQLWIKRYLDATTGIHTFKLNDKLGADRFVWANSTRPNSLLLSTATLLNSAKLGEIYKWLLDRITNVFSFESLHFPNILEYIAKEGKKNTLKNYLIAADVGITDIDVIFKKGFNFGVTLEIGKSGPAPVQKYEEVDVPEVRFRHKGDSGEEEFTLNEESKGTLRMLQMFPIIIETLKIGNTLVIDELENSLHPNLVRNIIGLFNNTNINTNGAQLIFTTHNTSFLDKNVFRRDQIWFTEKNRSQATELYPLTDFSPRKHEAIESGYLTGRYGAIPFIGDFDIGE